MSETARVLLLQTFAAMASEAEANWPSVLAREAARRSIRAQWRGVLSEMPATAAVRIAHALEMGPEGLLGWCATWPLHTDLEAPPLQLSAGAAALLAGREGLFVLAAAASGDTGGQPGALVDGESCARMAVAGFDAETEIRLGNCAQLLESAGDCVSVERRGASLREPARYLVLGMKWHAPAGH